VKRLPRTETLLVFACAGAAAMLGASQFTDIFHLTPPGGEALQAISSKDQHSYATLVLAIFALILIGVTLGARDEQLRQVAAMAIAICGLIALLIFLIGDLPDVNKIGTLDDPRQSFIDAEAKPVAGFWLELVGSLVLTVCGAALATMRPSAAGSSGGERRRKASLARTQGGRRSERTETVRERDGRPRTPRDEALQAPLRREDPPYQR
jgi:multisubunit Na+/H+ antiporter MnhC subunit